MLTATQITEGATRLVSGKLTARDIDQASSILSMDTFFGGLVDKYGYDFKDKLADFEDVANPDEQTAAQIAACLNQLDEIGFGVASFQGGGRSGMYYKEKDEYWQYVQIIFLKMYPLPEELATYSKGRVRQPRASSTARSERYEAGLNWCTGGSEKQRRFS